jgi:isoquinoline 1-oxidoreductase beta subunit
MLLSTLGAAGALIVGWGAMPARSRIGKPQDMLVGEGDIALNGWISIAQDGTVGLAMHRSEMGQGVQNALTMLVAEELDTPMQQIVLHQAGFDSIYGNVALFMGALPFHPVVNEGEKPLLMKTGEWLVGKIARELGINATGGSASIADSWENLRYVAAMAKASLLMAAAKQWQLPIEELKVVEGKITHASGKSGHFGEFAKQAAGQKPTQIVLKQAKDWIVIGQETKRADIPPKTDGSAIFGLDVRLPKMVYATVIHAPMMGGTIAQFDEKQSIPGVLQLVALKSHAGSANGFAVVAQTTWAARRRWSRPRPRATADCPGD